jgi:hypothetical protein
MHQPSRTVPVVVWVNGTTGVSSSRSAQTATGPGSVRTCPHLHLCSGSSAPQSNSLTHIFCMLSTVLRSRSPLRALHTARTLRNQKWPQLTNILAGEIPPPVQVKSITPAGVLLQDGRLFPSACIFLEGEVLLWDVPPTPWKGWDESKFEVFDVVVPKPGASPPEASTIYLNRCLTTRNFTDRYGKICPSLTGCFATVPKQARHAS